MALRRIFGCLPAAVLAVCALAACKGSESTPLDKRCEQLGRLCGDADKHDEKIISECKQAAAKQVEKKCVEKVTAAYDCFEKELCGKSDKVWSLDDFRVLADRHDKCKAERDAASACVGK
jgi:hypothetical protein